MVHLGFDDTDSRQGRCTTYLATEFVREFADLDLIGYPRLVRLNPNIRWKTRGNGALYLRFGRGRGTPHLVGEIAGRPVLAYPRGVPARADDALEARVRDVLEQGSDLTDPTTQPGYALLDARPPPGLYWRAVRGIVPMREALAAARGLGRIGGYRGGRGRIGALAAASWRPRDRTFEVLAYRERSRWGTPREVDEASVVELDRRFPSTFNNYDAENRHVVIAPRSPCPVLFGVRGDVPGDLRDALGTIASERVDRWLLFETNQGTDDHLVRDGPFRPRTSVTFGGIVAASPTVVAGGHVVVTVRRGARTVDCVAYEPAKQFRQVVRALRVGDRVRVSGAVRASPRSINLEKLTVLSLADGGPPRRARIGTYEPPPSARRHLAKPLKRGTPPRGLSRRTPA